MNLATAWHPEDPGYGQAWATPSSVNLVFTDVYTVELMPNKCHHKFDLENDPAHRTFLFGLVSSVKLHWQDLWFRHRQCAISCTLPGKYEKPASDSPRIWSILAGPMNRL